MDSRYSETLEILPNKRIIVTGRKITPYLKVRRGDRINSFYAVLVDQPNITQILEPRQGNAYLIEPQDKLDFDTSWIYGGFLTKICNAFCTNQVDSLALVRPGFLESLVGYPELDKLRAFIHEE